MEVARERYVLARAFHSATIWKAKAGTSLAIFDIGFGERAILPPKDCVILIAGAAPAQRRIWRVSIDAKVGVGQRLK
jgi:hypothetical protein